MSSQSGLQSLFSQKLDRALFATYFLGAVIPLMAFGYGVQRFALPAVAGDDFATAVILGIAAGVTVLSLAAFFALRKLSLTAVRRMDDDNERLATILSASRDLASAPHVHAAAGVAAGCAHRLAPESVVLVLRRAGPEKPFELCESAGSGAQELIATAWEEIVELVEVTVASGAVSPLHVVADRSALSLPLAVDEGEPGALVVVASEDADVDELLGPEVVDALATLARICAVTIQGAERKDTQRNFFTHATEIMVTALDARDERHAGGCHAVAQIANRIGRELGLGDESLRRMHFAALLSDIGLLKLTDAQQRSPQQRAKHPVLGHRLLSRIRLWEPLAEIVLHHHDAYTAGEEGAAPVESRIINVADAWVELQGRGRGGTPLTAAGAVAELEGEASIRFDPAVVAAVRAMVERGELDVD